ncbi:peptidylprolyl isomerase [Delftia lacustris]|nr:peptidylprolyl isomerase [Delftia lacustris]
MTMQFPFSRHVLRHSLLGLALCAPVLALAAQPAAAASPAVLASGAGVSVTVDDLQADAQRIPPEVRSGLLARPQNVSQIADNLLVRRVMAQKAQAQGLGNSASAQAALNVARDKILSDAWLAKIDADNTPSAAVAESQAHNIYKAHPERFAVEEQVHVRHILIAGTEDAARTQAEKLVADLRGGADFAALAKERSADKGSAARGGDLGFFGKDKMVPEFEQAAFALKKNEISGPVQSKFGFHVLQLLDRKPAGQQAFAEVRDALVKEVIEQAQAEGRVAAANAIRKEFKVDEAAVQAYSQSQAAQPKAQ